MAPRRVAFDTNGLVSAAIFTNSVPGHAVRQAFARDKVLLSGSLLFELTSVLLRKKFNRYTTMEFRIGFIEQMEARCELVNTTSDLRECRDSKDNFLLNLAVDGNAQFIVTGDQDLLCLHPFRGIQIVLPSAYLLSV